ncbi:hypothetical protein [Polaribacter sp. L3A8]|uniref:hypothetical protein n=1 Tax=Polaribacter sp. L3A8 TaxID=2686361 RepID=UPI00131CBC70|nr:hypothetical protein [Polaribacter sp. L3A8]
MSELNIRVSNISQFNFKNAEIIASTENGNINIENLNSGQITEYITFEKAQLFPHIELEIEGKTYTILPYSTGFEDIISGGGNYTYQIDANENQEKYEKLSFSLIKE